MNGKILNTKDNKYILYTNNNNLRHYMSLDTIVPKKLFETTIYNKFISDYIDFGLLLFEEPLQYHYFEKFTNNHISDNIYPIALKLNLDTIKTENVKIIDNKYQLINDSIENIANTALKCIFIDSYIPFFFIESIIFQSNKNKSNFYSTLISNIEFDESLFEVNNDYFNGNQNLEIENLQNLLQKEKSISETHLSKLKYRNKIRGIHHAIFEGYKKQTEQRVTLNFDQFVFNIFNQYLPVKKYSIRKDIDNIISETNRFFEKNDIFAHLNYSDIDRDFLLEHLNLRKLFLEILNDDIKIQEPIKLLKNPYKYYDIMSCQFILIELIKSNPSEFNPTSFIKTVIDNILDHLPKHFEEELTTNIDNIKLEYQNIRQKILGVKSGNEKLVSLLSEWSSKFTAFKALVIFITTYDYLKFNDLRNKIDKFSGYLNLYDQRLIWIYWSSLNGMTFLGHEFKKNKNNLYLSEFLTFLIYFEKKLVPRFFNIPSNYSKRNVKISHYLHRNKKAPNIFNIANGLGFNFFLRVDGSLEATLYKINEIINNDNEAKLKQILIDTVDNTNYILWTIKANEKVQIIYDDNKLKLYFSKKPILEKEWQNWDEFKGKYLSDIEGLKKIVNKNIIKQVNEL